MAKFTTTFPELTRVLALLSFLGFNKKRKQTSVNVTTQISPRSESEGERSSHVLPEIGECNLAIALFQFELERAKLKAIA